MKRVALLAGLVVAAVSGVPCGAKADARPLPKTGTSLSVTTLPEGHVAPEPVTVAPGHVPAREHADGMKTSATPPGQRRSLRRGGNDVRFTFVSELGAENDETSDMCLVDGGDAQSLRSSGGDDANQEPREWPSGFSRQIALSFAAGAGRGLPQGKRPRGKRAGGDDVHAVHGERFVPGADGRASLSIVDAWVDARTRGVRAFARSSLPLARVFVGPNGLEVYAARDGERIQVVFRAPANPDDDPALSALVRTRLRSLSATAPDQSGANSDCGHLRVVLHSRPGGGEMTTLAASAFLQPLGAPPPAPDGETAEQRANRLVGVMRQRPFQLSVSTTSLGADPHALLSVGLGWTGRETTDGSGA